MDKYSKLKEIIKNIVREEVYAGKDSDSINSLKKDTKYNQLSTQGKKDAENALKQGNTVNLESIDPVRELAAPTTATYALKGDADERLKEYLPRIKKESVKRIVTKMVDILKTEDNLSVGELFTKLQQDFANDTDASAALKSTVNVKGWLWGGINSDEFNKRYTTQINPVTGEKWEPGDLNAVTWTPFVRSKDKRLTDFEKAQQQAITDPEAFAAKQASFKKSESLAEKVLDYKFLRADYFTKGSQQRADVKIDKSLKGKQGEITVAEKMTNMLTDELAVALLYQWEEGYFEAGIDEPLKLYANKNGLLAGKKPEGLTDKYDELLIKLIDSKQIKQLSKKEYSPKKKQAMSKDDIEAYYKSIGMERPDDEKVDLTGVDNIFGDEEDEEL